MDRGKYQSIIFSSFSELRFWKMLGIVMIVCNILLCIFAARVNLNVKTILVPLSFKKEIWVKGDEVSPTYIEEMASLFFEKLLTFNKSNVLYQFGEILKYVDPKNYEAIKTRLYSDAKRVERTDMSSAFHMMAVKIKPIGSGYSNYSAIAEGELVTIVGTQVISKTIRSYQIIFSYRNNRLLLDSYNEIQKKGENE